MDRVQDVDNEFERTYAFLCSLDRFGILLGLENITNLLNSIGNPQASFQSVHITGSKGKGSTASFLNSILLKANLETALYTSPHLNDYRERVRINGKMISKEEVIESAQKVKAVYDPERTTYFEFTTAVAFDCIAKRKPDLAIIEVGLGGRLDATNTINPLVSIITDISREHEEYLGQGIYSVAKEKAGIIKKSTPTLTSATRKEALKAILETAKARSSSVKIFGKDFKGKRVGPSIFDYQSARVTMKGLDYSLAGGHQMKNASLAIAAVEELRRSGYFIPETAIRAGISQAVFPGRFEIVSTGPDIIIDAAHTTNSMRLLRKTISQTYPNKKAYALIGILEEKNYLDMLKIIQPVVGKMICVKPQGNRALEAETLAEAARSIGMDAQSSPSIEEGLTALKGFANKEDLIIATGSIYMIGPVRKACGLDDE